MQTAIDTSGFSEKFGLKPGEFLVFCDLKLIRLLGKGAHACVFLAIDLRVAERKVVVKITSRASREIDVLARLRHPNISPVLDVRHDEESAFVGIVMPYESQRTLRDHLVEACIPGGIFGKAGWSDDAAGFMRNVCDGLTAAHQKGIIHADVKPENLLLRPDDSVQVIDFGLAPVENGPDEGGTGLYFAPERIAAVQSGEQFTPNTRCDIYSVGICLFELLRGRVPFCGATGSRPAWCPWTTTGP